MKPIPRQLLLTAVACVLMLGTTAAKKNPNRRPWAWEGTATLVADFTQIRPAETPGYFIVPWHMGQGSGTMDHLGLYTLSGQGEAVLDANFNIVAISGDECATAANGDKLCWHMVQTGPTTNEFTIQSGGTGRFRDATGVAQELVTSATLTWDGPLANLEAIVYGTGWIAY